MSASNLVDLEDYRGRLAEAYAAEHGPARFAGAELSEDETRVVLTLPDGHRAEFSSTVALRLGQALLDLGVQVVAEDCAASLTRLVTPRAPTARLLEPEDADVEAEVASARNRVIAILAKALRDGGWDVRCAAFPDNDSVDVPMPGWVVAS